MEQENTSQLQQERPKYDPARQYQWKPDDTFTFTGLQFMVINQALTLFITEGLTDMPTILKLIEAFGVVQAKMKESVEEGSVTEYETPVGQSE